VAAPPGLLPADADAGGTTGIGWCKDTGGRKISATCRDVFCPTPADFRFTDLWSRRADNLAPDSPNAPIHLVDKLLASDMKADGAAWRSYQMPEGWPHQWIVRTPRTAHPTIKPAPSIGPKVAHYLCFSLQCRVPLLPKFIVSLSEQFRAAANSHLCKVYGESTPSFALFGHERPPDVKGDHQHAFYLPMAKKDDQNGFLSDLHICCLYGFTQAEIEILLRINRLSWGSGRYPVRPVLTALSKEPPFDAPFSTGKTKSKLWRSVSPFVPPRYFYRGSGAKVKLKAKDRPELQLAECLRAAGILMSGEIRRHPLVNGTMQNDKPHWDIVRAELGEEFATGAPMVAVPTHRNGSIGRRGKEQRIGGFFEVEFVEPVTFKQPALGHSCHFGLGLFVPIDHE
jgi:CRISPR-associated protein Csb2